MAESNTQSSEVVPSSSNEQPAATETISSDRAAETPAAEDLFARFRGDGTSFKAKLIGVDEVPLSRGDKMCQDSILKLKGIVTASGEHKPKIIINISLNGLKLINLMTGQILHEHRVEKISFIARDLTDRRAFGYICDVGEEKHKFFAIKTAKVAEQVVLCLRDLFQAVYDMKKIEVDAAKQKVEDTDAATNKQPVDPSNQTAAPQEGSLVALQKELDSIHQMSDLDAFKSQFPANTQMSPNQPNTQQGGDMFGMAPSLNNAREDYSDDLAALSMDALQPAANGGAKLTKDQILAGFGQGVPASGMYQQQPSGYFPGQQQFAQQPAYMGVQQPMFRPAAPLNPFGGSFNTAPLSQAPMTGYAPVLGSARPGAMAPPASAQTPAGQNPFGDAFGNAGPATDNLLAPVNLQPDLANGSKDDQKKAYDPFASLIPGMGAGSSNKKDMFKNFQIAKPPQPLPRSSQSGSAGFG